MTRNPPPPVTRDNNDDDWQRVTRKKPRSKHNDGLYANDNPRLNPHHYSGRSNLSDSDKVMKSKAVSLFFYQLSRFMGFECIVEDVWKTEAASKSFLANNLWMQPWFDNISLWNPNSPPVGRHSWLIIGGLPVLGRNLSSVKAVVKDYESDGDLFGVRSPKVCEEELVSIHSSRTISRVPCSENMENDNGEHNIDPINFGQEGNPPNEEPVDGPLYPKITNKPPTDSILNFNITSELSKDDVVVDQELDDLLSSFQLLSDKADDMKPSTAKKRKAKNKKINLLVGDTSCKECSVGASGGIFSMSDNRFFSLEQKFSHQNFVGTIGSWVGISVKVSESFLETSMSVDALRKELVGLPDFGPKPFKVFDKWVGNAYFLCVIERCWDSGFYNMSPDLILKNKIKKLRCDIKEWTSARSAA
ncbi:hypothetical protein Tco_0837742 [Tanacetum coccineum]